MGPNLDLDQNWKTTGPSMDDDNAEEGSDLLEENYYTFLNLNRTVSHAEKYYAIPSGPSHVDPNVVHT